jgi:MFS family permease
MFVMVTPIARDLSIAPAREGWIPTSYAMVFAAFLLLAGRLADLYPPHIVFTLGYFGLGVLWLAISFVKDQYAFFVLRAVCALFAVLTVPSSLNMIVQMFPSKVEQAKRLALFGMAGALASTLSPILVGLFLMASWRWFFRLCVPP